MDIDCCRNVRVSNCSVNSPWDDGICPKSSYALGYARSTENVTITGCYVTGAYQLGTMLDGTWKHFDPGQRVPHTGRIKCGTESNGGFKNITITNCVFDGCQGLALETVDGALLEDITVSNITMRDIVSAPLFLRLGARLRGPAGTTVGRLRRINISNIEVSNSASRLACILSGIPGHPLEDIHLSNIHIQTAGRRHSGPGRLDAAGKRGPVPGTEHVRRDARLRLLPAPYPGPDHARRGRDAGDARRPPAVRAFRREGGHFPRRGRRARERAVRAFF